MKMNKKSRLLAMILALTMILSSLPFFSITSSAAEIAAGTGSVEDPYQITSVDELMAYNDIVNGGTRNASAILMADIDLEGKEWKPLGVYSDVGGYSEGNYSGTFDGNGYIISNLTVYCDTPIETGFISRGQGATLKNITIVNADITNTASTRSGILGGELYMSTVENCFTTGTVTITADAKVLGPSGNQNGGIAGEAASTTLKNCGTSAAVLANGGVTYENCFYVAETDNDNKNGSTNIPSADMIATGEAAYLMNEVLGSTVWYQNIDATEIADPAPVASNAGGRGQVYKVDIFACPDNATEDIGDTFSNTNEDQTLETHTYTDGFCDYCGSQVTPEELTVARADARAKLNSYVDADDYREAEQAELASAISDAEAAIDAADTYEKIDAALEAGKTVIDGIKTNNDYLREELESYMAPKREELQNYVDKTLYREAQQALIDQAIADGIAAINKCTSEADIDVALADAKTKIDEIPDDLDMYKSEAIDSLKSYKDSGLYRQSDYLPAFNRGKDEILACADKDAVTAALETAKTYIDALKTDEEVSAEEQETEPNMVLTNKSFETGSFSGWSKSGGTPEVVLASETEVEDGKFLTATHGDYAVKLPGGALFNRGLGSAVPGTSYKLTFYVYNDANMSGLKGRTPNVWLGSSTWDPNPFCGTARQYTPIYVNTTEQDDGWVKYEMTYPAFPYNDDGSIPWLNLSVRNWTGTTYYLDNFKVEAIDPIYAVNFTDKAVDDVPDAFSPLKVADTTGTNAVKALKLDADAEVIIPLDASKLTVDKWYSVMVGTANRTDFVAEPTVDSEVKVNLYTKVDGNWVDAGVGTTVKASDLFAYANNNTAGRIQLMTHNKFRLPSAASGEYALGLKYTSGDVGMDLTYITMANIHIPDETPDLFLYEAFDYEVTEGAEDGVRLQSFGEKGGFWPGTWGFAEDRGAIESGSVYYEDADFNMLKTSGNMLHHGWPWSCNAYRTFALKDAYNNIDIATDNGELGLPGTTVYASFLFNNANAIPRFAFSKGGGTYRFGNSSWYPAMNNPAIHILIEKNAEDKYVFKLMDSNAQTEGQSVLSNVEFEHNKTYLMVLKMEFGPENKFSLYVNPSLNGEPETADAVLTNNMTYALDSILVDGQNTYNNLFDEFRLAKTYAAAAPSAGVNLVSKGKVEAVAEINGYLNADEYRDAEKETITSTIATWTETINACTTVEDIETALADAKAALDAIKTDAELTAEELAAAKVEAIDELKAYKSADDYRDAEKTQLADAIAASEAAINACTVIDEVPTALANAKVAIDAIKTDAQYVAEELAAAKDAAKAELDTYKNADDYRDAQKTELTDAITAGKTAIDACTVIADVPTALADTKAAMDEIKTDAELTAEELAKAKEDAKAALDEYNADDYRDAEKVELADAIAAGKTAIDACEIIDDVTTALADAKAVIDGLKTNAQYELEEKKAAAIADLEAYKNAADYREAEQTVLATTIENAKAEIEAAADIVAVDTALTTAKAALDGVKTAAQLDLEEAKAAAIAEIEAFKNAADYREAEQAVLAKAIADAKAAIESATDIVAIKAALTTTKASISIIKTDAQLTAEEQSNAGKVTVKFVKKTVKLKKGKKATLKIKIKGAKKAKFSLNKKGKKVVKILKAKAKNVTIKAIKKGTAKITAKVAGKKTVCKVVVK